MLKGRILLFLAYMLLVIPFQVSAFDYSYEQVFNENRMTFSRPVDIVFYNDNSEALVLEKGGRIYHVENKPTLATKNLVLDISYKIKDSNEEGLLGIALDPTFLTSGYFYIQYSELNPAYYSDTRLSRFVFDFSTNRAIPSSEIILVSEPQFYPNHKGGRLTFGNDGYLYFAFGDGGVDPWQAQNRSNFKGSMMRIDISTVDITGNYSIPSDNPFVGNDQGILEEIIAYGFRNPWRFSIDYVTDTIWVGDVGEVMFEEIDIIEFGGNYGWPYMEANDCFNTTETPVNCGSPTPLQDPVYSYSHSPNYEVSDMYGAAVVGGYVYRGSTHKDLVGKYIFSDFLGGVWSLEEKDGVYGITQIANEQGGINTYAVDQNNEIIITTRSRGANIFYITGSGAISEQPQFVESTLLIMIAVILLIIAWSVYWSRSRSISYDDNPSNTNKTVNNEVKDSGEGKNGITTDPRFIPLILILISGFLLRISGSLVHIDLTQVAASPFGVNSQTSPLPYLYYQMMSLIMDISPIVAKIVLCLINVGIILGIVYLAARVLGEIGWEDDKISMAVMTLATILSLDPNMIRLSRIGHFSTILMMIVSGLVYYTILQVKIGDAELKWTVFAVLLILSNYYMVLGVLIPLIWMSGIGRTFDRSKGFVALGFALVLSAVTVVLDVFAFDFGMIDSLKTGILPRNGYIVPVFDYIILIFRSSLFTLPYIVSLYFVEYDIKKANIVFLIMSLVCSIFSTSYIASILLIIQLVMIVMVIYAAIQDKTSKFVAGSLLFVYTIILLNSGVNVPSIAEYFRIALIVKSVLILVPAIMILYRFNTPIKFQSKGTIIGVSLILLLIGAGQMTLAVDQPEIIQDEELIDIGAFIDKMYSDFVIFVPDIDIQLQLSIVLPTADTRITDDVNIVLHFIDEREDLGLILIPLNQIDKTLTSLIPTDYNKQYPEMTEVSQAGDFVLYLLDYTNA